MWDTILGLVPTAAFLVQLAITIGIRTLQRLVMVKLGGVQQEPILLLDPTSAKTVKAVNSTTTLSQTRHARDANQASTPIYRRQFVLNVTQVGQTWI